MWTNARLPVSEALAHLFIATLAFGCSPTAECVEGTTRACVCGTATTGIERCGGDSRFGACDCGDAGAPRADAGAPRGDAALSPEERCSDGRDDDDDGYTDCDDADCYRASECEGAEDTLARCSDGNDNDGNGFADCADLACSRAFADSCTDRIEDTLTECSDGLDNDRNGFADCRDLSCSRSPNPDVTSYCDSIAENTVERCRDGFDNDGDGFVDCEDFDCSRSSAPEVASLCSTRNVCIEDGGICPADFNNFDECGCADVSSCILIDILPMADTERVFVDVRNTCEARLRFSYAIDLQPGSRSGNGCLAQQNEEIGPRGGLRFDVHLPTGEYDWTVRCWGSDSECINPARCP